MVTGVRFESETAVRRDGEVARGVMKITNEEGPEVGELPRAKAQTMEFGLHAGEGLYLHLARAP